MTLLTSWFFWLIFLIAVGATALITWIMVVVSRVIFNVFLSLPIEAEPFRNEEGILQYSVNLRTRDGVSIKGFFIPGKEAKGRTVVFCHEIGAGAASYQKYGQFLIERGFNLFTFDFRGHGLSGNSKGYLPRQWVTSHEITDMMAVLKYLKTRRDVQSLGLFGISKGAGTALVAAAKRRGVKAIVSDGGFSTAYTQVDFMRRWTSIYLPFETLPSVLYWMLRVWTLWVLSKRIKCRFPAVEKAVPRLHGAATFFINGEKDGYISFKQAERFYSLAKEPKEIWIAPKARHNEAVVVASPEYQNKISAFFEKYL